MRLAKRIQGDYEHAKHSLLQSSVPSVSLVYIPSSPPSSTLLSFEVLGFVFTRHALYHLNHASSPLFHFMSVW
jgi:hypothetical protein